MRPDGRLPDELRPISFERDYTEMTPGSVLVSFGRTRVLCTASVDDEVPRWMRGRGTGWVTAEYAMLPGSSPERVQRKVSGRSQEIQRLIGRSLRSVCDMKALGERLIAVDCDVLQADGGTRTASITGACIAVSIAFNRLLEKGKITRQPLKKKLAAVSVGIVKGETLLDLCYTEDAAADVDSNIVLTEDGEFVEIQGSGEEATFTEAQLHSMLEYGRKGIKELIAIQDEAIQSAMKPADGSQLQNLAEFFGKK